MAKNDDEINIELFIGAVKYYPELRNVAAKTYHDGNKKRRA
jgi:hypothetical protein